MTEKLKKRLINTAYTVGGTILAAFIIWVSPQILGSVPVFKVEKRVTILEGNRVSDKKCSDSMGNELKNHITLDNQREKFFGEKLEKSVEQIDKIYDLLINKKQK